MGLVLSLTSRKGGVGKSTLAINLAAAFAADDDVRVLVVDLDNQATLTQFYIGSAATEQLPMNSTVAAAFDGAPLSDLIIEAVRPRISLLPASLAMNLKQERCLDLVGLPYDLVLIDTPPDLNAAGAVSALLSSNCVVSPLVPEPFAVSAVPSVQRAVVSVGLQNRGLRMLGFVVNAKQRVAIHAATEQLLRNSYGPLVFDAGVTHRVDFKEAALAGQSIQEYKPRSAAAKEIKGLVDEITARLEASMKRSAA
jgi:chromosome partitioning protein|tara:strand:- start:110 stop:868 length:759 start_codon:yes stop_codon:yes gene_type:complete